MHQTFTLIFAITSILLGAVGFIRKKSKASLIAGSISGILLLVAWYLMSQGQASGLWVGLVVSVLLLGRFLPAFLKTKAIMPAGIMAAFAISEIALIAQRLAN